MKKYLYTLLFMAVALFSAATLVSCGDDDDDFVTDDEILVGNSIAKTTWAGTADFFGETSTYTLSFNDGTNGVIHRVGKIKVGGELIDGEVYGKFTYTFDGKKGKISMILMTYKKGKDMATVIPDGVDSGVDFTYNSTKNAIILSDTDIDTIELKKMKFKEIEWVEEGM